MDINSLDKQSNTTYLLLVCNFRGNGMNRVKQYEIVKSVLDKYDPMGLLDMGAPSDEYSEEATIIESTINQSKGFFSIKKIVENAFVTQFGECPNRTICAKIANEISCEFHFENFCDELRENETLKGKIEVDDYVVRLKLHDDFIVEYLGNNTTINGKFYYDVEEQDILETFCAFCTDDYVYVEYNHKHYCPAFALTRLSYFDVFSKDKFSQKKIKHPKDVKRVFGKNGLIL